MSPTSSLSPTTNAELSGRRSHARPKTKAGKHTDGSISTAIKTLVSFADCRLDAALALNVVHGLYVSGIQTQR